MLLFICNHLTGKQYFVELSPLFYNAIGKVLTK